MQSDDDDDTETPEELRRPVIDNAKKVTYSIKLISPLNPNGDKPQKWTNTTRFSDVARLRSEIKSDFGDYFDGENFEIVYIEPGHGARGRQVPIVYTEDLTHMYSRCNRTRQIVLWAKPSSLRKKGASSGSRARKRPDSGDQQEFGGPAKKSRCDGNSLQPAHDPGSGNSSNTRSKYSAEHNKVFELQEIVDELEKLHTNKYTTEQLRAWGHMMMMKKHDSYDHPPDKPFFKQRKEEQAASGTRSPGKRIHYRSECMDQLDKWHSLLQRGVITQE